MVIIYLTIRSQKGTSNVDLLRLSVLHIKERSDKITD